MLSTSSLPNDADLAVRVIAYQLGETLSRLEPVALQPLRQGPLCDQLADLLSQCLLTPHRYYHNLAHVLAVARTSDPIEVLAGLFHDAVYLQTDHTILPAAFGYLEPFLAITAQGIGVDTSLGSFEDPIFQAVALIFGIGVGQVVEVRCINEFLSALLALKCFEGYLELVELIGIATCIEATVPFVLPSQEAIALRRGRLLQTLRQYKLSWSPAQINQTLERAVRLANRDLAGFASDAGLFLGQTWQLLPENNPALRQPEYYTLRDYRVALQRMETFMKQLTPDLIFNQVGDEPLEVNLLSEFSLDCVTLPVTQASQSPKSRELQLLHQRAAENLAVARLYLESKLVALGILEAIATFRWSVDRPLIQWLGTSPPISSIPSYWESRVPLRSLQTPPKTLTESRTLQVLEEGRRVPCFFDLERSPMATFVVKAIGFERVRQLRPRTEALFRGNLSSDTFLNHCEARVIQPLLRILPVTEP